MPIIWRLRERWDSIDEYRRWFGRGHLRRQILSLNTDHEADDDSFQPTGRRPMWAIGDGSFEDSLCARLDAEEVLGCLPTGLRRPLMLRAVGYSSAEIAERCGYRNANTADVVVGQARRRMRQLTK
jgi:DNA-directed RNA polymerase specialized sigma24 family protein